MMNRFGRELRVHRQRKNALRVRLSNGEVAALVAQILVGRLQVNRYRIMDARTDASADQILPKHVAVFRANHIEMPNRFGTCGLGRRYDSDPLERLLIELGIPAAGSIPL